MALICDRCFNPLKFNELVKYKVPSDFDFCKTCFEAIINSPVELDSFVSRDTMQSDLKEFLILMKIQGSVLGEAI